MQKDLEGKVILITGATDGLGKAAALNFATRGATLTLIGRSPEKTARVLEELRTQSGNERIDALLGDLAKLSDVRAIAAQFKATHDRLDVLVNNAGAIFTSPQKSADGYELTFAVNHLAHFLLTTELLQLIRSTPGARVVSTSSGAHQAGKLDLSTTPTANAAGFMVYGTSKLANVLFTRELARRLEGTSATANCFHPGYVQSSIAMNNGGKVLAFFLNAASSLFGKTPAQGADSLVWLATAPEAASLRGEYIANRKPARMSAQARDPKLAEALWALSAKLCAARQ